MKSNAYYIKVVMGDPYNDCKSIITDYMFEEANSSVDEIYCIINEIKKATSTKEKLDLLFQSIEKSRNQQFIRSHGNSI